MQRSWAADRGMALLLVLSLSAATGGFIVMETHRAVGIVVRVTPGGDGIYVWNPTTVAWGQCTVTLDDHFRAVAAALPARTLVELPMSLFATPEQWQPEYVRVRCHEPHPGSWDERLYSARF